MLPRLDLVYYHSIGGIHTPPPTLIRIEFNPKHFNPP